MFQLRNAVLLAAASLCAQGAMADAKLDTEMNKLAATSGCLTCHGVESAKPGPGGMMPIGPTWVDVAARYQGKKEAADNLLKAVMQGSSPYSSHWKDKTSGLSMPPNAVAIKEADAKKLVRWILDLKK